MFDVGFFDCVRAISFPGVLCLNLVDGDYQLFRSGDEVLFTIRVLAWIVSAFPISCVVIMESIWREKQGYRFWNDCRFCHSFWVSVLVWLMMYVFSIYEIWTCASIPVATVFTLMVKSQISRKR